MTATPTMYPELPLPAQEEAQQLMDKFKDNMLEICDNTLDKLYCDVTAYIESDHWNNFRNELLNGLKDYGNAKIRNKYDFVRIREVIFQEHKDEIINDLNQDLLDKVKYLEDHIVILQNVRRI